NWGDGTGAQVGTITFNGSSFNVNASHTYAEEGDYVVSVTITDHSATQTVSIPVHVLDAAFNSVTGMPWAGTPGISATQVIATFKDNDPNGTASDYSATISWGDGTTSPASFAANGSGGFNVSGTHAYAATGTYTISLTIIDTVASCPNCTQVAVST